MRPEEYDEILGTVAAALRDYQNMMVATNPRDKVRSLLDEIRAELQVRRIHSPKIEEATDEIETILKAELDMGDSFFNWGDRLKLTPTERKIAEFLHKRMGKTVRRDALMDTLYSDDPNGGPDIKIIDVLICKLRHGLIGSGLHIETDYAIGYRMMEGEAPPRSIAGLKRWEDDIVLGEMQFAIATLLKASLGKIVEYSTLHEAGFDYRHAQSNIQHLRDKLAGRYVINSVRGVGWRMKNAIPSPALAVLQELQAH